MYTISISLSIGSLFGRLVSLLKNVEDGEGWINVRQVTISGAKCIIRVQHQVNEAYRKAKGDNSHYGIYKGVWL
jgi:hypothetical protein